MDALPENRGVQSRSEPCGEPPRVIAQAFERVRPPLVGAVDVPSILHACDVLGTGTGSRNGQSQIEGG